MASLGFSRARGEDLFSIRAQQSTSSLRGEEVRHFYEELVRSPLEGEGNRRAKRERQRVRAAVRCAEGSRSAEGDRRVPRISERTRELWGLKLLRLSHEGDMLGIRDLLSKGVDINYQDTFLWTALMCAAWSGQSSVVRLLLRQGAAWVGVVDMQGRDARDLASEAGHRDVLEELKNNGRSPERKTKSDRNSTGSSHQRCAVQPQWCHVCSSEYRSDTSAHLSSTLHQFSLRRPPPAPYYCLPPSSNSFKMMVRSGWKPGEGLGPEGGGPQQPVATVLKRDQQGLGYGPAKKAKVTHFRARDQDAVELARTEKKDMDSKGQRKQEDRKKEQRDKTWEREFRSSFHL